MNDGLVMRVLYAVADLDERSNRSRVVNRCALQYSVTGTPATYSMTK